MEAEFPGPHPVSHSQRRGLTLLLLSPEPQRSPQPSANLFPQEPDHACHGESSYTSLQPVGPKKMAGLGWAFAQVT